jgi:hypothetical protein
MAIPSANSTLVIENYLKYPSQPVMFASPEVSAIMTPDQVYSYHSGTGTVVEAEAEEAPSQLNITNFKI